MFTMEKMQNVENPLTQIVNGIIVFLQSGEYKDTTGIAFKNQSVESKDRVPQNISVDMMVITYQQMVTVQIMYQKIKN